jgi:GT2 family glycosyltransferase
MEDRKQSVAAVVVTFNRLKLLKKCIQSLKDQTRKLDEIMVVNNSSSDGTIEWLNSQNDLTVITQENSGSAGGQYTGIKTAYKKGYDWVWCLDTDVVVDKKALENFFFSKCISKSNIGFLSSTIFYKDGNLAYINIPYLESEEKIVQCYSKKEELPILSASFGSVLFSRNAIKKVGFPNREFFIWGDDVEYTFRIIKTGFMGFLINDSVAIHHQNENLRDPFSIMDYSNTKMKFAIRNSVHNIKLRNNILKRPKVFKIISVGAFLIDIIKNRYKRKNKIELLYIFYTFKYVLEGVFFNPRLKINN